ncbi:hypothetical protein [Paenibacillus eucommiae]|uniref:Uncharacterized protein n=1 Tax=Paenibacillus eucommiae TaxID=1355755 RepID=A0ABS4IYG5_9BACL|nr:hypothetical protein [Paenibacillus eucommiae]MBP1992627.1 hypothetical protein [Paenibacillus eucommiae]
MIIKKMIITFTVGALVSIPILNVTKADAPAPGSASDPVITKSYFDQNSLSEDKVKQLISSAIAGLPNGGSTSSPSPGAGAESSSLKVVQLKMGQILYAGEGAELIVRTGKTVAVSNDDNGIPDVTAGKDISAGKAIENNHLLIFPRDGRGVKPAAKNTQDIFIMVRGGYLVLNEDGSKVTP